MIYPTRSVLDRSLERCKIVDDEAHTAHGACRSIGTVCFERAAERDERTRRSQRRAQITGCSLGRHGDPAEIDSLDRRARQRGVPVLPVITERSGIRWNEGCLPLRRGPIESVQERRARYRPQRCGCEHSAADEPAWDRCSINDITSANPYITQTRANRPNSCRAPVSAASLLVFRHFCGAEKSSHQANAHEQQA